MFEGLGEDLRQGHVPNFYAEMGGPAEWRHNRADLVRKALVFTAVVGLTAYLVSQRGGARHGANRRAFLPNPP